MLSWKKSAQIGAALAFLATSPACQAEALNDNGLSLIRAAKALADGGDLNDPEIVGQALHVRFAVEKAGLIDHDISCSGTKFPSLPDVFDTITSYALPADFRFGDHFDNRTPATIPDFQMGRTRDKEHLHLKYEVARRRACYPGYPRLMDTTDATLEFYNIPSSACVTEEKIKFALPEAEKFMATDGVWGYNYQGRVTGEYDAGASFTFVWDQKCSVEVQIRQTGSNEILRTASRNEQACMDLTRDEWRKAQRTFNMINLIEACGPYWDYFPGGRKAVK